MTDSAYARSTLWQAGAIAPWFLRPSQLDIYELLAKEQNLVERAIDLLENGDDKIKAQIIKMLMEYLYAKRRPEDVNGNPDDPILQPVILSPEAALELLKAAKEK